MNRRWSGIIAGLVLLASASSARDWQDRQGLRLKQTWGLQDGILWDPVLCGDTDHDCLAEVIWQNHEAWRIWEYRPVNRFELVYTDSSQQPAHGVWMGSFTPHGVGDPDCDTLSDLLGYVVEHDVDSFRWVVGTVESPARDSYPRVLTWSHPLAWHAPDYPPCYIAGDLDNDQRTDLYCHRGDTLFIFENTGNSEYRVAWDTTAPAGSTVAFGDFDMDGHQEWVSAGSSTLGLVWLYENTGDDAYSLSWMDTVRIPNGVDAFSGNDLDGDGKPEFFICFAWFPTTIAEFYLYMWEATGNNSYERTLLAHKTREAGSGWNGISMCGDVDADGKDELVWTTGTDVFVYRATGNNQFTEVWNWQNPTQSDVKSTYEDIYDLNCDGYNELVLSGVFRGLPGYPRCSTCVFEVEAVQVVEPNGGQTFVPGETCQIRWRTFTPPRCDSVSLFLRTDTTIVNRFYQLDTIAHGLSPTESTYSWVVPDTTLDSAWIVAIAYGPGWQFDESDSAFKMLPGGVAEARQVVPKSWSLSVSPNPARGAFRVSYDVPENRGQSPGAPASDSPRYSPHFRVGIYDVGGRLVQSLADGAVAVGRYSADVPRGALPAGTYFVRLDATAFSAVTKVVMQ